MPGEKMGDLNQALRAVPSVNEILRDEAIHAAAAGLPRSVVVQLVREAVEEFRSETKTAGTNGHDAAQAGGGVIERCCNKFARLRARRISPAINATGIIIHTGMGRSPLASDALTAIMQVGSGYSDVAISREDGGRRARSTIVEDLLRALTGCEAALVANNNAAAVMLALATHARGREVIVSRGQLVEIGGSFRLPDVMAGAGAILREVGTTNRTRLADYEAAVGENTAAIMRIHPSNFRMVGFTESAELKDLVKLGRERGVMFFDDIGSGALIDFAQWGLKGETTARESVDAGADLVLFSGDKLLGGPQAGILAGRRAAVEPCSKNPLMRALRVDKLTLAALEATLRLYLDPERLPQKLPLLRMITDTEDEVRRRARRLAQALKRAEIGVAMEIVKDVSYVGGGSLPDESLPTYVLAIPDPPGGAEEVRRRLRLGEPSVFARVRQERLEFDLRTVFEREVPALARAIQAALTNPRK